MASGSPLMLAMMMSPPTSLRRRRLLGRGQEAVCEGEGEHLADLLGHRRCQPSSGDGRHEFGAEDSSHGMLRRESTA
jgi:hypothetical protein